MTVKHSVLNETSMSLNMGLKEYYGARVGKIEVTGRRKGPLRVWQGCCIINIINTDVPNWKRLAHTHDRSERRRLIRREYEWEMKKKKQRTGVRYDHRILCLQVIVKNKGNGTSLLCHLDKVTDYRMGKDF